jgi:hypothetical protein
MAEKGAAGRPCCRAWCEQAHRVAADRWLRLFATVIGRPRASGNSPTRQRRSRPECLALAGGRVWTAMYEPGCRSVYIFLRRQPRSSENCRPGQKFPKAGWFARHLRYFLRNIPKPPLSKAQGSQMRRDCCRAIHTRVYSFNDAYSARQEIPRAVTPRFREAPFPPLKSHRRPR